MATTNIRNMANQAANVTRIADQYPLEMPFMMDPTNAVKMVLTICDFGDRAQGEFL